MEAGKERLARETVRDATQQEVQALRRENLELKQLVAELSLEGHMRRLEPGGGRQTCSAFHQRWEVRTHRSPLAPIRSQLHPNRPPMRTVPFCVD